MDPKKLQEFLSYAALIPNGIGIVFSVVSAVKGMIDAGEDVTDDKISAIIDEAVANHAALPVPK